MNITEKSLEKGKATSERQTFRDDEITGFGVRIEPKESGGRKSFFYNSKVGGQVVFKSLGEFPTVSVKDARDAAKVWSGRASKWKQDGCPEDTNPFAKPKKQERTTTPTLRELVESYIANHVRRTALHPKRAEYDVRLLVKNHFESLLDVPLDKVTVDDVLAAKNKAKGNYMQNSVVEFARRVYNWSAGKGNNGKLNFWKVAENPAKDIALNKREKRRRFLGDSEPEELMRFWEELKKEPHKDTRDVLTLLLATGARKSNIYEMAWANISIPLATWRVPMSKSGEGYDVNLTRAALDVLEPRKKSRDDNDPGEKFVFPANSRSGHITDIKKRWAMFRKRAGIPDVRLHDLRRTKGSMAAIAGESLQKIGALLGHKSLGSTQIYAQLNQESVRNAGLAADAMMQQMMDAAKKQKKREARKPKSPKLLAVSNG